MIIYKIIFILHCVEYIYKKTFKKYFLIFYNYTIFPKYNNKKTSKNIFLKILEFKKLV